MKGNNVYDMDGQCERVAKRFALSATAGMMATEMGILPWGEFDAYEASEVCFKAWLAQRGGTNAGEEIRGVEQVSRLLETEGELRFAVWRDNYKEDIVEETRNKMLGWRRVNTQKNWDFYAHASGFAELTSGFNKKQITQALIAKGILLPGENGEATVRERIPHHGQQRVYRLNIAEYGAGQSTN